jgi:hypothetical protein
VAYPPSPFGGLPMSAVDNQEQARKDAQRTRRDRMRAEITKAAEVLPESVGVALEIIAEHVTLRLAENPADGPCKVSLALMKGGDWCCSINNWTAREGLSAFAPGFGRCVVALAERLVAGDPWKRLPG